jgi:biopolymer transport protein ExbD
MHGRLRKQRLVSDINITPFTDVILVLLVIFMITTPLISQSRIKVNVPEAKSGSAAEDLRQEADISITREGMVYLDGKLVTRKELRDRARAMHANNPGLNFTVHSDKNVRFQEVVAVLDPLNDIGISKINIAVSNETD